MLRKVLFTITIMLVYGFQSVFGLDIINFDSADHNRFLSGFPGTPVENPSINFDLSGVGWTDQTALRRHITMISPQHFIAANHFLPSGTVHFLNQDGVVKDFTIDGSGFSNLTLDGKTSDLIIGKLTSSITVSDKISSYPLLDLNQESDLVGRTLIVYGRGASSQNDSPRVGSNEVHSIDTLEDVSGTNKTRVFLTDFDASPAGESQGQTGDSGSPSFTLFNSQLTIAGNHFAIGTDESSGTDFTFDSFMWFYKSNIASILSSDGETLQLIAIPELNNTVIFVLMICSISVFFKKY